MKLGLGLVLFLGLSACQMAPTKSYESQPVQQKPSGTPLITEQTVIVDARPPFEFALSHLSGSINLQWEDFAQRTKPFNGLLELDTFALARRLAAYGISLTTPVLVVGKGVSGKGEEGRLAWTLKVLGVERVRFANIDGFSLPKQIEDPPPRKSEPLWKPVIDDSLTVDRAQFLNRVMRQSGQDTEGSAAFSLPTQTKPKVIVIDVRSEAEYLGKDSTSPYATNAPDIGAINIPWTEFFDLRGLTNQILITKLESVGIAPNSEIYVIDNFGVRSAGVTLALREMGFSKAANFAGGYMELIDKK